MNRDPLLTALFDRLPTADAGFDPFERQRWIAALSACLDVVYGPQGTKAPPATDTASTTPRRGPSPVMFQKEPCERCGVAIDPRGLGAHLRMHEREDTRAAANKPQPRPDDGETIDLAAVVPDAEPEQTRPPLVISEPISRPAFDHDAARRRAAAAI